MTGPAADKGQLVLEVDGERRTIAAPGDATLLSVLRDEFARNGPKYGCGAGYCGACTVVADGVALRSCVLPVAGAAEMTIRTLDGLRGADGGPHPLQQAFIAEQAAQCGYCTSGMIMSALALLEATPHPTEAQVRSALDGNLCRCGTHNRVVRAVLRAAGPRP